MFNLFLIGLGLVLFITGVVRCVTSSPAGPQDGDTRVIKMGGSYWLEHYQGYPGWRVQQPSYTTIEAALSSKQRGDEIRKGSVVVETGSGPVTDKPPQ